MNYFTSSNTVYVKPEKYYYNYFSLTSSFEKEDYEFSEFINELDLRTTQQKIDDTFSSYRSLINYIPAEDTRPDSYNGLNNLITESTARIGYYHETKSISIELNNIITSMNNYSTSYAALVNQEILMHDIYIQYIHSSVTQSGQYVNLTPQGQALLSVISGNYINLQSMR